MTIETWIRIWRAGFCISVLGVFQFVVCCGLAMLAYPGGSIPDSQSPGYSIGQNYLSDLGRNRSFSGEENRTSARLFSWSMIALAVSIVPFFLFLPTHAPDRVVLLRVATVSGVVSSIALIVIASTPTDIAAVPHVYALLVWIAAILVTCSIHFLALFSSKEVNLLWSALSLAMAMLTVSYMGHGLEAAAAIWHGEQLPAGAVIMQKVVVGSCLLWFFVFSIRTIFNRNLTNQADSILLRDVVNQQAKDYMSRIGMK